MKKKEKMKDQYKITKKEKVFSEKEKRNFFGEGEWVYEDDEIDILYK